MHATRRKQHTPPTTRAHGTAARFLKSLAKANPLLADREFVCNRCDAAWAGAEADCWHCGLPATFSSHRYGSALQRLFAATTSAALVPKGAAS
ncbi:hypothetical protein [Streptomyces vietnamensis]|uniref:Uncharacterized protein n=1 Tax=Streptomyces vietnamensis TaxID=362257 RepID=A0A0B5ILE7_9ACTN|nr:hypothetical protein [Streptomyces vietnamensis]AJF70453.1 hypothetical protein SVTN_40540 [Streptomyces vietnamensis]